MNFAKLLEQQFIRNFEEMYGNGSLNKIEYSVSKVKCVTKQKPMLNLKAHHNPSLSNFVLKCGNQQR